MRNGKIGIYLDENILKIENIKRWTNISLGYIVFLSVKSINLLQKIIEEISIEFGSTLT